MNRHPTRWDVKVVFLILLLTKRVFPLYPSIDQQLKNIKLQINVPNKVVYSKYMLSLASVSEIKYLLMS